MIPPDFRPRVARAVNALWAESSPIVATTERAVVGRLAIHLHAEFQTAGPDELDPFGPRIWDVEYMRAGGSPKRFRVAGSDGQEVNLGRALAPDLVWHRRLLGLLADDPHRNALMADANLVVIEVKLRASDNRLQTDRAKLSLLTGDEDVIAQHEDGVLRLPGDEAPTPYMRDLEAPDGFEPYQLGISLNIFRDGVEVEEFGRAAGGDWDGIRRRR